MLTGPRGRMKHVLHVLHVCEQDSEDKPSVRRRPGPGSPQGAFLKRLRAGGGGWGGGQGSDSLEGTAVALGVLARWWKPPEPPPRVPGRAAHSEVTHEGQSVLWGCPPAPSGMAEGGDERAQTPVTGRAEGRVWGQGGPRAPCPRPAQRVACRAPRFVPRHGLVSASQHKARPGPVGVPSGP